jgi:hypothetical protein
MLFTVFEFLPSKETLEMTLGEKGDVIKSNKGQKLG